MAESGEEKEGHSVSNGQVALRLRVSRQGLAVNPS